MPYIGGAAGAVGSNVRGRMFKMPRTNTTTEYNGPVVRRKLRPPRPGAYNYTCTRSGGARRGSSGVGEEMCRNGTEVCLIPCGRTFRL